MRKELALLSVLFLTCSVALAEESIVLEPGFKMDGQSASTLSAVWWKWAMADWSNMNPVRDETGILCAHGQTGSIWFLAGAFRSSKIVRTCNIPFGKSVFFPVINNVMYRAKKTDNYTCDQAKSQAAFNNDDVIDLFVEIDGVKLKNVQRYRANTEKCFNVFERAIAPGVYNAYPSASDGYWIGIQRLEKGQHTLKFGGKYPNGGPFLQDIEYVLNVK